MTELVPFHARTASQEVDAVCICPAHPDFMVYGTYTLIKSSEARDYEAQVRKGTVCISPVDVIFTPTFPGQLQPYCETHSFPCGVYDLTFHLDDPTLLVAAMSNGSIHFFRFVKHGDILGRRVACKLLPLGDCVIAEPDDHGLVPLITCVRWLPNLVRRGSKGEDTTLSVSVVVTTSFGEVKLVQVTVADISDLSDVRLHETPEPLSPTITPIHTHSLEAWCVAHIHFTSTQSIVLSGGDDSVLQASLLTHSVEDSGSQVLPVVEAATSLWSDRRTHSAGVTALLPLISSSERSGRPGKHLYFLTGSYDESLQLFAISRTYPYRATMLASLSLGDGVFNINLLSSFQSSGSRRGYIVLCSCMHAGAKIVRITRPHPVDERAVGDQQIESTDWSMEVEKEFKQGHASIVYACDGLKDSKEDEEKYKIVSTSFYDMEICTWDWDDGNV